MQFFVLISIVISAILTAFSASAAQFSCQIVQCTPLDAGRIDQSRRLCDGNTIEGPFNLDYWVPTLNWPPNSRQPVIVFRERDIFYSMVSAPLSHFFLNQGKYIFESKHTLNGGYYLKGWISQENQEYITGELWLQLLNVPSGGMAKFELNCTHSAD